MTTALWLALGLEIGKRPLNFFGFSLTGHVFAALGVVFVALEAVFNSVAAVVPALLGLLLCLLWRFSGHMRERYGFWRLRSKLKLRRQHLKVHPGDKRPPPNYWH